MGTLVTGIDHVGYVVTDLDAAVSFFIDVLGFQDLQRRGELVASEDDRMTRLFGVHPRAHGRYVFLGAGDDKLELLTWTSPDQSTDLPKNSDLGGRHIAVATPAIDELARTIAGLNGFDVRERNERGFIYVHTPFGLEVQLIPVAS